jgi:hypothetical protein
MSKQERLRRYLRDNGYTILEERLVYEEHRLYTLMRIGEGAYEGGDHLLWSDAMERDPLFPDYIRALRSRFQRQFDGSGSEELPDDGEDVLEDYDMVAPTGNFTNVLDIATEADGVTLYNNGHGYKNDTRYSSSSMSEVEAVGWDLTGYFSAKQGDVIRMKNVEFYDINDTGGEHKRNALWWFNEDLSHATQSAAELDDTFSPVFGENGDVIQFTIPSWGSTYKRFRICAKNITGASVITVNEAIDV